MNNPLVSIIVPCYNQAQYLPETLDSVLAQTYPYWECIIVNDGSPDNTEEIAKHYCDKDIRFKYVYKENGGLSSARNVGIKNSLGEFILPLDSDDLIGNYYLEEAIRVFEQEPKTKLVYCKAELFGELNGEWKLAYYDYKTLLYDNVIFCSSIFKRIDYNVTKGYDENLKSGLEDWDFYIKLLDEESIVYKLPKALFFYRIRNNSMLRSMNKDLIIKTKTQIYNNNYQKFNKYIPNLIWNNNRTQELEEIIIQLRIENNNINESKSYKLGKAITKTLKKFKINI